MAALDTGWDPETLESMKVADLRALCKRRTIPGTSRLRKQELIDRILAGKSSSNSKDPSEGRTGATAAERKGVSSRFQGKMTTKCMEMVRDGSLSKYRSQCAAKSGCDHYRTRSQTQLQATTTAPAAPDELEAASSLSSSSSWSDSASLASLQIDHTFECQAVAHALVSTESMHKILKHVDLYASRKYQPKAVQRVVAVVFPVQNERKDFFNIKLLPQALQQEGEATTSFLKELKRHGVGEVDSTLYYKKLAKNTDEHFADALMQELRTVRSDYVDRLQSCGMHGNFKAVVRHASGTSSQFLDTAERKKFELQVDDLAQNVDTMFGALLNE